jgi:hypothetical protein
MHCDVTDVEVVGFFTLLKQTPLLVGVRTANALKYAGSVSERAGKQVLTARNAYFDT